MTSLHTLNILLSQFCLAKSNSLLGSVDIFVQNNIGKWINLVIEVPLSLSVKSLDMLKTPHKTLMWRASQQWLIKG